MKFLNEPEFFIPTCQIRSVVPVSDIAVTVGYCDSLRLVVI